MVIGVDSYHNAGRRGGSVCGFVASTNASCTSYFSKVCFQHNHGELVDGLRTCMQCKLFLGSFIIVFKGTDYNEYDLGIV